MKNDRKKNVEMSMTPSSPSAYVDFTFNSYDEQNNIDIQNENQI